MANFDLKPCPFCGSEDIVWSWNHSSKWGYFAFVKCDECGAQTKIQPIPSELCDGEDFSNHDNMEFWRSKPFQKVTELWNQRKRRRKTVNDEP